MTLAPAIAGLVAISFGLSDFDKLPLLATKVVIGRLASPHCTKQVNILTNSVNGDWVFPLKNRFDKESMTLEGREEAMSKHEDMQVPPSAPADFIPPQVVVPEPLGEVSGGSSGSNDTSPMIPPVVAIDSTGTALPDTSKVDVGRREWERYGRSQNAAW
jgi:hypothetical protein